LVEGEAVAVEYEFVCRANEVEVDDGSVLAAGVMEPVF
jgi:hypothetical protein